MSSTGAVDLFIPVHQEREQIGNPKQGCQGYNLLYLVPNSFRLLQMPSDGLQNLKVKLNRSRFFCIFRKLKKCQQKV